MIKKRDLDIFIVSYMVGFVDSSSLRQSVTIVKTTNTCNERRERVREKKTWFAQDSVTTGNKPFYYPFKKISGRKRRINNRITWQN